ncbi:hypothetical protein CN967_24985 [Bacillus cereus]|nr:hypothetical protein COM92_11005 [Bacillus cereus]PGN71702.1 hypothetical protein CN967_24985 [Bacillus cereus]
MEKRMHTNNRHDCWETFWKEQVTVDGELDIEQVKQELFNYKTLLDQINQPQNEIMQPQILIQLAAEERIQKHREKQLALA